MGARISTRPCGRTNSPDSATALRCSSTLSSIEFFTRKLESDRLSRRHSREGSLGVVAIAYLCIVKIFLFDRGTFRPPRYAGGLVTGRLAAHRKQAALRSPPTRTSSDSAPLPRWSLRLSGARQYRGFTQAFLPIAFGIAARNLDRTAASGPPSTATP